MILSLPTPTASSRVSQNHSQLLQKDPQNSLKAIYSWLWLITGKRYRLKLAKGRAHKVESRETPNKELLLFSPVESGCITFPGSIGDNT